MNLALNRYGKGIARALEIWTMNRFKNKVIPVFIDDMTNRVKR